MAAMSHVDEPSMASPAGLLKPVGLTPQLALLCQHVQQTDTNAVYELTHAVQVVRSVLWSDSGALVSGGEDARLVQWSVQPSASGEQTQFIHKPSQRVSNSVTRKHQAARHRQSPY